MTALTHSTARPAARFDLHCLPERIAHAVWRGSELAGASTPAFSTGFAALDAALPEGGWPTHSVSEVLLAQTALCEWRLLSPALPALLADRTARIYLIGPPQTPQALGLAQVGLPAAQLLWIDANSPADRLWATEQIIKSDPAGAVLAWIAQARADQVRRLQVHAQSCGAPVFLFRPEAALGEASAAPLRLSAALGAGWQMKVRVHKRRGAATQEVLHLDAMPRHMQAIVPPWLRGQHIAEAPRPDVIAQEEVPHALGRTLTPTKARHHIAY